MADFVQGFLADIELDGNDQTSITVDFTLSRSRTVLDKATMDNTPDPASIPGMTTGTLAFNGHVSQAELNLLEVSFAKTVPVAWTITIVEGLTTDGSWSGEMTFDSFDVDTSAEDNWGFAASGALVGLPVFTPSAP